MHVRLTEFKIAKNFIAQIYIANKNDFTSITIQSSSIVKVALPCK